MIGYMRPTEYIKNQLKLMLDPMGRDGFQRRLPLLFWSGYARIKRLTFNELSATDRSSVESPPAIQYNDCFFRNHLLDNLLPFWSSHAQDEKRGGYIIHLDRQGKIYNPAVKHAAMQARLIYAFSAAYSWQPSDHLFRMAQHGAFFLTQKFWDTKNGGWFQSVDRVGNVHVNVKRLFDQAYVIIGLSQYYQMTQDVGVLNKIVQTFDILDAHAWDKNQFGYIEACGVDWSLHSAYKTICVQLDMLRATIALYQVTHEQRYRQRSLQLADMVVKRMCDPKYGCVLEKFHSDWRYSPVGTRDQVQIGHNLKGAWLMLRANDLEPNPDYVLAATRMVDFCLHHGWDTVHGGFFQYVYRTGPVASPIKHWWPECEGLNALITLYKITGNECYWNYFQSLAEFVFNHFVDHQYGEWFTTCWPDGAPLDDNKGGDYKSAYHTVQMCIEVANCIGTISKGKNGLYTSP